MTSGQKVAFSLLISVLVFCGFTVVAFSGLFDLIEVNFYQPVVRELKEQKIGEIASAQNEYFETLIRRFDSFTREESVKSYLDSRPSDDAAKKRETLRTQLVTTTNALTGIRIVDDNGRNVYFSTFSGDLISSKSGFAYRNYDATGDVSFDSVKASDWIAQRADALEKCRLIKDGEQNRLIFSFPFYDKNDSFCGSILFYCDASYFGRFLFNRNLIDINGFAKLVTESRDSVNRLSGFGGFVFGLPNYGQASAEQQILAKWHEPTPESFWKIIPVEKTSDEQLSLSETYCAFSHKNARDDFGFIAMVYDESELQFPPYLRLLILATAFITFYLAIFLILSFRHDDIVVIRDKVHRYENEFLIACKKMGDAPTPEYFAEQRAIIESRLIKSLGRKARKHAAEFQSIFDSSWNEMLASFGELPALQQTAAAPIVQTVNARAQIDAEELREIVKSSLEDILESGKLQIQTVPATVADTFEVSEPFDDADDTKNLETVAPVEVAENAEPVEDIEDAESVEELDEAEPLEEVEDAAPLEEIEPVEEIEEVEPLEDIEDAEPLEEIEPVEEIEEVEPLDEIEDAEPAEPLEEIESPEELDEAEPLEDAEDVEPAEEIEPLDEEDGSEWLAGDDSSDLKSIDGVQRVTELPDSEITPLDAEGLLRQPSFSEQYDINRLKEVNDKISTLNDANLDDSIEELEELAPDEIIEKNGYVSASAFVPGILSNNVPQNDDIYKDEEMLEIIEFGVPLDDKAKEEVPNPVVENFVALPVDYSYLDEDDMDGLLYATTEQPNEENEHFYENPALLPHETENNIDTTSEELSESADIVQESIEEPIVEIEEFEAVTDEAPVEEVEELSELGALEKLEDTMPFSLTQLASNGTVTELSAEMPDSIVQSSDGTFSLSERGLYGADVQLDAEFKKLVDSVLR
ncbi:MAG: hypothetical protein IJ558_06920 [Treponema sp.]|nr:hypothetical protein [Treponema sp.]